jgi:threonine dehydrogenase-like Zn-dependent dehydrogenase
MACICGSDLHPYHCLPVTPDGRPMGHEFLGVVEDVGASVSGLARGDVVVAPFVYSDGTCDFCRDGLHTSCRSGSFSGADGAGQAEAVRVPQAEGTLVKVPVREDDPRLPSLLTCRTSTPPATTARSRRAYGPAAP